MAGIRLAAFVSFTTTLVLLFNVYLQGVGGATFTITNKCSYTVWAAGIPVGGGQVLGQGQTWTLDIPAGTSRGRFLGRIGCSFDASGHGNYNTGDCGGVLSCQFSGWPTTTLVEYTMNGNRGNQDFYDLFVIDGFNVPLSVNPFGCRALRCDNAQYTDAYHHPNDPNTFSCPSGASYGIFFYR